MSVNPRRNGEVDSVSSRRLSELDCLLDSVGRSNADSSTPTFRISSLRNRANSAEGRERLARSLFDHERFTRLLLLLYPATPPAIVSASTSHNHHNMNSIPNELKLQILHHHRDLLPDLPFATHPVQAMARDDGYNTLPLRMSLYHREWTALAQSELFHRIILMNPRKTELLWQLLREKEVFAGYAKSAKSIRVGRRYGHYDGTGLKDSLEEIASYCPEIVELCANTTFGFRLEYLRMLPSFTPSLIGH
jgi:hypothetical protein